MDQDKSPNVQWHASSVTRAQREQALGQRGVTVWFTGLSGSGKSTLARAVEHRLVSEGRSAYVLDGDNLRHGLNGDLGFSPQDRRENIRRIGEIARLFTDAGIVVMCAFVSPYRADRDRVRGLLPEGDFVEVYVSTPLEECERRDPKGLYRRARAGEISDMTGLTAPYEPPERPEMSVDTAALSIQESSAKVIGFLLENGYLAKK
ncbi:MAG: adenylyl-sulfate kinase [Myxococcales bacterium]|nr:adenylyl-sulfate kinase [Myxococcales bacterium]